MTSTTDARPSTDGALLRYRVMAYAVGVLLVLLTCVAMPLKYANDESGMVRVVAPLHGWLFVVMLVAIADLWRRRRFPVSAVLLVAVSGLVPFLTFYAEHRVTSRVRDGRY
jgi:integral membrane protein